MNVLHFFFGVCGNAAALFLFLSPSVTFKRILKNKNTEQFSGFPYVMSLLNCLICTLYGLPFVSPNNILVTTVNGTGAVIETVYVLIFLFYAPKKEKLRVGGLLAVVLLVFTSIALVTLVVFHRPDHRKVFCGVATTVFSIVMYGSPLSAMRVVIRTKSVEYMPFLLSLFVFLCGTSWFIYGLLGGDPFVAIPNGFGCTLGAIQLAIYFKYYDKQGVVEGNEKNKNKEKIITTGEDAGSLEMGCKKQQQQKQEEVPTRDGQV